MRAIKAMWTRFSRLSLLWKIQIATSFAITLVFGLTGLRVQSEALRTTSQSIDDELRASFEAYKSIWRSKADLLSSVSLILSTMSDVRAAFSTGDQATIRDTAGELWRRISDESALFLVTDPNGALIASLGGRSGSAAGNPLLWHDLPAVRAAAARFPQQSTGYLNREGRLYQIAITPVYVQSGGGQALLDVLVAGYAVDSFAARHLKEETGGSEFLFLSEGRVVASTLSPRATQELARNVARGRVRNRISDGVMEYAPVMTQLLDIEGKPIGELWIFRSFENALQRMGVLRRNIVSLGILAVLIGLLLTYLLARNLMRPIAELDRAAAEVARQNYDSRVRVSSQDELGRLANTFNAMCASIQSAREELIRQERISTIGRLSSSIVHDLRNPLAAIYGGAEILVDTDLAPAQVKRLAGNIYRASRRIQELLQDLVNVGRGKTEGAEMCRLREVAAAARDELAPLAQSQSVSVRVDVPEEIELPMERARMERVFLNLIGNALEAMPLGGAVRISASIGNGSVVVKVEDTGPGISPGIRSQLFHPFVSAGKRNGLGLGLALSRQTVLDHGGDMWADSEPDSGACFRIRLPLTATLAGASREMTPEQHQPG